MIEVDSELFEACLARGEQIRQENPELPFGYRSTALTSPHGAVSLIQKLGHGDGTASVFFITAQRTLRRQVVVRVEVWHDSHDLFWQEQINDRSNAVVVGLNHYRIGDEMAGGTEHSGHGGRRFGLRDLLTGKVTETSNLWYQGIIPPKFREALPPTHEFYGLAERD